MRSTITSTQSNACFFRFFLFLFFITSGLSQVSATHLAGGDIEYECIGARKWKVRLIVYRLCGPASATLCANFSCPQSMVATPGATIANGGLNPNGCVASPSSVPFTLQLVSVEDAEKSRLTRCGAAGKNNCTNLGAVTAGTYTPGVERYIFEGTLDMSSPAFNPASVCPYWDLSWDFCCRNSTENLQGQPNFHIEATINIFNRSSNPCSNNSPQLKQEAIISFCAGMEHIFNMGAVDPDRDSLSYEIVKSLQATNSPVNYNSPYNERFPFPLLATAPPHNKYPGTPFVVLDTITGDLAMTPFNTGTTVISGDLSVRIKQWSYREEPAGSGIMVPFIVGITMRNLQIMSVPCAYNNAPRFSTSPALPNGQAQYNWAVCAGEQVCFTITAKDTDYKPNNVPPLIDSTWISWSNAIVRPAGMLTFGPDYVPSQRPREDRWKFCWQTDVTDGSTLPYYFTVRADDNRCPNPGKVIQTFSIRVLAKPMAGLVKQDLKCGKWIVNVRKTDVNQTFSSALLEVAKAPNDHTFSNGADSTFSGNPNPSGTGTAPRTIITDTVQFTQPGMYFIKYTVSVQGAASTPLCTTVFYDSIYVDTLITAHASADVLKCAYDSLTITGTAAGGVPPYTYRWYRNNTQGVPINGPNFQLNKSIKVYDYADTKYILRVQDLDGCVNQDTMEVKIKSLPSATILVNDSTQCVGGNEFKFSHADLSPFTNYTRTWQSDAVTSSDSVFTISYTTTGTKTVTLIISENGGCSDTVSTTVQVMDKPAINNIIAVNDSTQCLTGNTFTWSYTALPAHTYKWILDNGNTSANATINQSYNTPGVKTMKLEIKNAAGCADTAVRTVVVYEVPVAGPVHVNDSLQCVTSNAFVFTHNYAQGVNYHWLSDNIANTDSALVKTYTTAGSKTVKLVATGAGGCTDTSSAIIAVAPKPVTTGVIQVNDSTQCINNNSFMFTYSQANNPLVFTHTWYNEGVLIPGASMNPTYTTPGPKQVQLVISQPGACTDTANRIVLVGDMPVVQGVIAVDDSIQCLTGNVFTLTYNKPNTTQDNFMWLIDGTTAAVSPLQHVFTSTGVKPVRLVITTDGGCSDTTETTDLTVKPSPIPATIQGPLTGLLAQSEYDYSIGAQQTGHTYKWYAGNGSFMQGDDSVVVRVKWLVSGPGTLKVEQTLDGCTDVDSIQVTIGSVGIKNISSLHNIFIKPNPNKGVFTIGLESVKTQQIQATLYNVLGELVWSDERAINTGMNELEVNVNVPDGIYLLTVYDHESKTVKRVLINH